MKRTERHHLKTNEFQHVTMQALDALGEKRREVTMTVLVVAVIALVAAGYWGWRSYTLDKAHDLLAQAMVVQDTRVGPPAEATASGSGGPSFPTERERAQAAI